MVNKYGAKEIIVCLDFDGTIAYGDHILEFILAPYCKAAMENLFRQSFRFVVVTSRPGYLLSACKAFIDAHKLPISRVHNTEYMDKWICKKLRARAMLDDGLDKLAAIRDAPVRLFFLRQPWNTHQKIGFLYGKITEIGSWEDFYNHMIYMKKMHEAICFFNGWENNFLNVAKIAGFWDANKNICERYLNEYQKKIA